MTRKTDILALARERVVVLDGGMGSGILKLAPTPDDYRGHDGCNEILVDSRPDIIRGIHAAFFAAGCDAVETDTFSANRVVLAEYGLADRTLELNRTAARLAREAAADFATPDRPRFVIGSVGPGTRLPSLGHIGFDDLKAAFLPQMLGLLQGGADAICIETCQDLLQIKAAVDAARDAFRTEARTVPLFISITIESTGTMLLGTDVQAAVAALRPLRPDVIVLNCATGPAQMKRHAENLSACGPALLMAMPNAGIPENVDGKVVYRLTPAEFADWVAKFVVEDGVRLVGGCCGTTPAHLAALVQRLRGTTPRPRTVEPAAEAASLYLAVSLRQFPPPTLIGERLNANGSKEFRERLLADDLEGMLAIAREQENGGAHLLDVCVAYVGRNEPADFSRLVPALARACRLPLCLDSTDPVALEAALKLHGGRCVINSINLEDGEQKLDRICALASRFGAAVIALAIDEQGMATTAPRKLEVAERIYGLCTQRHGLAPQDLIFDMLTFTVASGDPSSRRAAAETLAAIESFKQRHPDTLASLGVSNVSYGLKPAARRVLNSVFLHEAVERGLDLAIVNARGIIPMARLDTALKDAARRLLLGEARPQADSAAAGGADPLLAFLSLFQQAEPALKDAAESARRLPPDEALRRLVLDGAAAGLEETLAGLRASGIAPLEIINRVLLPAMKTVGELFGAGQMQLPFVLQSAEVTKAAVRLLEPFMDRADRGDRGTLVLATVKGDVHDIGKNLVDILVSNNGFKVVNLGIKVSLEEMLKAAAEHGALAIGMSGLLVKSTVVMKENLEEMVRRSVRIPVLLGGAALSRQHVETDLRRVYGPDVHYCADAFDALAALGRCGPERFGVLPPISPRACSAVSQGIRHPERAGLQAGEVTSVSPPAREGPLPWLGNDRHIGVTPAHSGAPPADGRAAVPAPVSGSRVLEDIPLSEVFPLVRETALFTARWGYERGNMSGARYKKLIHDQVRPAFEALKRDCLSNGWMRVRAVYGWFPCFSRGDDLVVLNQDGTPRETFTFPRKAGRPHLCIADWFRPESSAEPDVAGFFVVTAGQEVMQHTADLYGQDRYKDYLHLHGLAVETAEAAADWMHRRMKAELGPEARGQRFSFGYPVSPDLSRQAGIFALLGPGRIRVELTETFQMVPECSVSAIVVPNPDAKYFTLT